MKLGKFLGRGNATHIFELVSLDGEPIEGTAIRIPFSAQHGAANVSWLRYRRYIKHEKDIPDDVPHAEIIEADEQTFRWSIVRKVDGSENGQQFLFRAKPLSWKDQQKKRQLVRLIRKLNPDKPRSWLKQKDEDGYTMLQMEARQFLWENDHWVLVDWDGPMFP